MNYAGGGLMAVPIAGALGNELPCRLADPDLFFAESPV